jgi:hypothetical protein
MEIMYNLTTKQREILKWIVKNVREANLDEEFTFVQTLSGAIIFTYGCTKEFSSLPNLSVGSLKALMESGLILVDVSSQRDVHCTLLGKAYEAIDSNFDEISWKNCMFGKLDKKYTYDVFVLMPFLSEMKPVYDDHIKETVKTLNLSIARADDFFSHNSIMDEIWSAISFSKILIADCTGKNPNVFYEIGLAHAIGKPVILITQNQDDVPFDLRHRRYIQYNYTPPGMKKFESQLSSTVLEILKDLGVSS